MHRAGIVRFSWKLLRIRPSSSYSQRIPTVTSDIAPYRRFAGLHGISDFQVVPNTFEAWKQAVETAIPQIPEEERQKG